MPEADADSNEGYGLVKFSFHDVLVDLLGGLVPGILFTVATVSVITAGTRALIAGTASRPSQPDAASVILNVLEASKDTPSMIWIGVIMFALLLSYVLGHIFYRRDTKKPDRASFHRLEKQKPGSLGPADQSNWLRRNLACETGEDCEFPYPYLADYLEARGHDHLLSLVPWSKKANYRTKTYVNLLKIRLNFYHPLQYRRIIRNEAHVRLATSTWYLARALWWVSVVGVLLIFIGLVIAIVRHHFSTIWDGLAWSIPPFVAPVTVLAISQYARISCEKFIHYQRLREVFYVLELAYTAFRKTPDLLDSPPLPPSGGTPATSTPGTPATSTPGTPPT